MLYFYNETKTSLSMFWSQETNYGEDWRPWKDFLYHLELLKLLELGLEKVSVDSGVKELRRIKW